MAVDTKSGEKRSGEIMLGGRSFEPAQRISFGHHAWMMAKVKRAGLFGTTLDADEFLLRVLESGYVSDLLAGALDEVGVEWTADRAEANAKFFDSLTDSADIAALQTALAGVLASFFLLTGSSLTTSLNSSKERPAEDQEADRSASAEISNSENSASSSASSPVTTPSAPETS